MSAGGHTIQRRQSRQVTIGGVKVGGDAPIAIQSMATTPTRDVDATVEQIHGLEEAGCEIVRVAVPYEEDARAIGAIVKRINIPLVADIHFNYRFALIALDQGISKLRLNPGNIGTQDRIEQVVEKTKACGIPIRIGVNSGSLEKDLLAEHGQTVAALVASAQRHVGILESLDFYDIVVSLKATDVPTMIEAYRRMAQACDYPLHLGVTEAGTLGRGTVYSSVGVGSLLLEGIGDTIRISLTADPVEEPRVGRYILESLGLREQRARIISCPSCGRAEVNVIELAEEVERRAASIVEPMDITVMGCPVNGPGESHESDFGISCGKHKGMIYVDGQEVRTVSEAELVDELFKEIVARRGNQVFAVDDQQEVTT